jgi:ubiquinone/menaquinone biosynthesis C-methylase UbiE
VLSDVARRRRDQSRAAQRHFDRWSRRYEADRRSRKLAPLQDEALQALDLGPGDALLDVGCRSGAAVRRAAAVAERAVGVDPSPGMLARAAELAAGIPNVEFVAGEAEGLPFGDGAFTAVLSTSAFHFPDPERAATEMGRVLARAGRLALGDRRTLGDGAYLILLARKD